jgi:hypothetical protein
VKKFIMLTIADTTKSVTIPLTNITAVAEAHEDKEETLVFFIGGPPNGLKVDANVGLVEAAVWGRIPEEEIANFSGVTL